MAPRLSGQNCKFFKLLLSLNSQKRLGYKENNTKYRILTRKPRSHVRILIYRTWPIADRRSDGLKCLHLLCRYLMRIFPFFFSFFNLAILFSEIVILWLIGNKTSCRPIRSVIILVINKSDSRCADVRFCYHSYDYRPNWTPLSPITITYSYMYLQQKFPGNPAPRERDPFVSTETSRRRWNEGTSQHYIQRLLALHMCRNRYQTYMRAHTQTGAWGFCFWLFHFVQSVGTGLNNVCARARSHGSRWRQRPGHHTKLRKNGGVFYQGSYGARFIYGEKISRATLKTVERNLYNSSLDHWAPHTFLYTGV